MSPRSYCLSLAGLFALTTASPLFAAEGGAGFYLLGSKGSQAGIVPPAGTYLQYDQYLYSGDASVTIPQNGRLFVDLDGRAAIGLTTMIWAPDNIDWNGIRPYLAATIVTGYKDINATGQLEIPDGPTLTGQIGDDSFTIGDPVLGAGFGGGTGPWYWSANFLVNVPVGDYDVDRLSNLSFNRWALDSTMAVTWMDADSGWEASGALGLTVNGENDETDYKTGDEAHFEAAFSKTFDSGWVLGLNGYHYEQISGDSGDGNRIGPFKGRVSAIGPAIFYNTTWGKNPVTLKARYYHEFNVQNRVEGDAVFLTISMPLMK